MIRECYRPGGSAIRIWTSPDGPVGVLENVRIAPLVIEWRSNRVGHPSTYGLLGGWLADGPGVGAPRLARGEFPGSLAGRGDSVSFGLEDTWALPAIQAASPRLVTSVAAEGEQGSSPFVFYSLAVMLTAFLEHGVPTSDEEIWNVWASAYENAREWSDEARRLRAAKATDRGMSGLG